MLGADDHLGERGLGAAGVWRVGRGDVLPVWQPRGRRGNRLPGDRQQHELSLHEDRRWYREPRLPDGEMIRSAPPAHAELCSAWAGGADVSPDGAWDKTAAGARGAARSGVLADPALGLVLLLEVISFAAQNLSSERSTSSQVIRRHCVHPGVLLGVPLTRVEKHVCEMVVLIVESFVL